MPYLENGVNGGQLAVQGNAENFRYQVCAQKVGDGLVDVEVTGAHPDFGQKPVIFCIRREENRVFISWDLVELITLEKEKYVVIFCSIYESLASQKIPEESRFPKQWSWSHKRIMEEGRGSRVCISHPSDDTY